MKLFIKKILQKLLGYHNYLYVFAIYIILTLKWNKKEKDFLYFLKLLPKKGIILDIGANIGVMSVYLSKKLPESKIFAFEPVPTNIKVLKKIIKYYKLPNVKIFEFALGNYDGETEMILPIISNVKMQGLSYVKQENNYYPNDNGGIKYTVPIKRLDSLEELINVKLPITGIKIDVENFEYFVLLGGKELIQKHHPVIYAELWNNKNKDNSLALLQELGYKAKVLINKKLKNYNKDIDKTQNFFFIPE
ncbi:MAG TPA: FkbM family methyltransferase [Bacteroidales bacterium]|nr:FkbM family methyltransferase [Bacteroidales bacterium]